jgi:hypothetical protein
VKQRKEREGCLGLNKEREKAIQEKEKEKWKQKKN